MPRKHAANPGPGNEFFEKIQTFLLGDELDLGGRRPVVTSPREYSASLKLHATLQKLLQSFVVDATKQCCETLERVFFQVQITCNESSLIDRIYENNNIKRHKRSNLFHLLCLLIEPLDADVIGMEWTLATIRRQQHSGILLEFLRFFQKNRDFLRLVIGRRADFWLHPQWAESGFVDSPNLFLKVMVCEGSTDLFDFLVEHDVVFGTRWAYTTHCEFFEYLHTDYEYIQDPGHEGLARRQCWLQEGMCKLDSLVKHNGTSILTFEYVWQPLTHLEDWFLEKQSSTMIGFYIENAMTVLTQYCSASKLQAIEEGSEGTESYRDCNSYLATMTKIIHMCPESLYVKFSGRTAVIAASTGGIPVEKMDAFHALDQLPKFRYDYTGGTDFRNYIDGGRDAQPINEDTECYWFSALHFLTCRDIYAMVLPHATLQRMFRDVHHDPSNGEPKTWEEVSHTWQNEFMKAHMYDVLDNLHVERALAVLSLGAAGNIGRDVAPDIILKISEMTSTEYRADMDDYRFCDAEGIMRDFHRTTSLAY